MPEEPQAFTLKVSDQAVADLRERLARTRFPDQAPGKPWAYGSDVGYLQQLVEYWRSDFDWRAEEARLNAFPQYKVPLSGIDLHFLHVPGKGAADDHRPAREVQPDRPARGPAGGAGVVDGLLDHRPQVDPPSLHGQASGETAGRVEQVVAHPGQRRALAVEHLQSRVPGQVERQHVEGGPNRCQRIAQLMREGGQKLVLRARLRPEGRRGQLELVVQFAQALASNCSATSRTSGFLSTT